MNCLGRSLPLLLLILANSLLAGVHDYEWARTPTILKTSRVSDSNSRRCGAEFEVCVGPATHTQDPNDSRMVKCYVSKFAQTCPTQINRGSHCYFFEETPTESQMRAISPSPACMDDGSTDNRPQGCICSLYGSDERRNTVAQCEQDWLQDKRQETEDYCIRVVNQFNTPAREYAQANEVQRRTLARTFRSLIEANRQAIGVCFALCDTYHSRQAMNGQTVTIPICTSEQVTALREGRPMPVADQQWLESYYQCVQSPEYQWSETRGCENLSDYYDIERRVCSSVCGGES